jgi:hypothetical protein
MKVGHACSDRVVAEADASWLTLAVSRVINAPEQSLPVRSVVPVPTH